MNTLTDYALNQINQLAYRYGVTSDAVTTLLFAVQNGNGTMAQFTHPQLGGSGQWMLGGMTMVGDMFNYNLQATVSGLCTELSNLLATQGNALFLAAPTPSYSNNQWWNADLGVPATSGAQNATRYAWFPATRRLAIEHNGQVSVYDTLDHQISGVSQQQGGNDSLSFSSQYGTVFLNNLPLVTGNTAPVTPTVTMPVTNDTTMNTAAQGDIFALIERVADLYQKGILSEAEFNAKKSELLQRL